MICYVGILLYSDINKVSENFRKIKLELIEIILLLESASLGIKSIRQKNFLDNIGVNLPFITNFKIYLAGMSMTVTPGGAGMLIKSHFLKRNYGSVYSKTFPVVLAERYHDLLAISTIILFLLLISFTWASAVMIIITLPLLLSIYIISRRTSLLTKFQQKLMKLKFLRTFVPGEELNESIEHLSRSKTMISGWLVSIAAWIVDATAVYIAFLSFNQDIGFVQATQFYLTSLGFGAISLLPGGVGVTEGGLLFFLISKNLQLSTASALVLFIRLTTIWFATIMGFVSTHFVLKQKRIQN